MRRIVAAQDIFPSEEWEKLAQVPIWDLIAQASGEHIAGLPTSEQLAPFRDTKECYLMAEALAQKYPHLQQDAGFYMHPKRGPGDHAWNVAPDGTIVDTTSRQHPGPEIVPPDHSHYPRYVSWTNNEEAAQRIAHERGEHYGGPQNYPACPICSGEHTGKVAHQMWWKKGEWGRGLVTPSQEVYAWPEDHFGKVADWTGPGQVNLTTQPPQNPMQEGPSPYANIQDWELNMAGATAEEARQWIMDNFPDVAFKVAEHLGGWAGVPEQMITIHLYGVSQPIVQQIVAKYGEDHPEEESVAVMPKGYESQLWDNPTKKVAGWQDHFVNQIQPIAHAYDQLPTFDPQAVGAWQELADDSTRRANELRQRYNITETDNPEPYGSTIPKGQQWAKLASQEMFKDLNRGNFAVSRANTEHPIWTPQQNVDFRIVHDILGHHASGGDFGWQGENQACGAHFPLLSPNAQRALMTECLGQTGSAIANKGFGPQKVGFMDHLLRPAQQTFSANMPDGGFCHRHLRHGIYKLGMPVISGVYTDVECPHCGQQFHDNGWTGYTPLVNGQMGERTHYCPNCNTDTREVVHRPIPIRRDNA